RFLEINTGTLAVTTNVLLGYDTDVALSLLPDPDSSGIRFVAMSNVLPQTSVFRYNSAGVLQTGDLLVAAMSDQVTGVAYQAGAGFMAVYHPITGGIVAVKKRGGVVSAPAVLVPAVATGYTLNTVAWRAIGTDLTRYILGLHSPSSDAQDSYFEMAVPFDTGATVLNSFPEPQARLLPLQSGPSANAVWPGALSHVQDLGNQTFCAGLVRLGRIGRASGT